MVANFVSTLQDPCKSCKKKGKNDTDTQPKSKTVTINYLVKLFKSDGLYAQP